MTPERLTRDADWFVCGLKDGDVLLFEYLHLRGRQGGSAASGAGENRDRPRASRLSLLPEQPV